jgi:anti-anti-sigma regulatory factor
MMRAQVSSDGKKVTLSVCGRLTEEFVPELENCWREARAAQPGAEILVDLQHVSFIDDKGSSLLERMHLGGARFVAAGLMTRAIVNKIIHKEAKL